MDPELFAEFVALAHEKAGISLRRGKEALVAARVARRQRALAIAHPRDYLRYLRDDASGQELARFLDVISTHYTSFFREADHLPLLQAEVAAAIDAGRRRVRLWSAAASSGEEPYTMAMAALAVPGADRLDLKVLATDIAAETLRHGAAGAYAPSRLEPVPPALRDRWFVRRVEPDADEGEVWTVKPALRERVVFRRLNLSQPPFPMSGPFDVVFCRNVLIYFDLPTRQRLVAGVEPLLRPGGLLCLGHTETLSGLRSGLRMERPSVFRRGAGAP